MPCQERFSELHDRHIVVFWFPIEIFKFFCVMHLRPFEIYRGAEGAGYLNPKSLDKS